MTLHPQHQPHFVMYNVLLPDGTWEGRITHVWAWSSNDCYAAFMEKVVNQPRKVTAMWRCDTPVSFNNGKDYNWTTTIKGTDGTVYDQIYIASLIPVYALPEPHTVETVILSSEDIRVRQRVTLEQRWHGSIQVTLRGPYDKDKD